MGALEILRKAETAIRLHGEFLGRGDAAKSGSSTCSATWAGLSHRTAADTDSTSTTATAAANPADLITVFHFMPCLSFSAACCFAFRSSACVRGAKSSEKEMASKAFR